MLTPPDDTCARSPCPHAGAEGCRLCEGAGRAHQQEGDGARGAAGHRRRRARAARGRPVQGP
eukprot:6294519-Prymnesium_polylepis.1